MDYDKIEGLSKAKLFELLKIYAKNWLAHYGCWSLAVENPLGLEKAIEFDREAWKNFTVIEVRRIKEFLNLPENCGVRNLQKALQFRVYSTINEQESRFENGVLYNCVKSCGVQQARCRKGLPDFPCQTVGIVEYSFFLRKLIFALRLKASRVRQMFPNPITIVYGNLK